MRPPRPWTWLALGVVALAIAARVATWAPRGSGLTRTDHYPAPTVPLPPGTRVTRLAPGVWTRLALGREGRHVLSLRVEIVFPLGSGPADSSRYEALYTAPAGDRTAAPPAGPHRVVVLAEPPTGEAWARRAAALTRRGQWCASVDAGGVPPSDSLVLLLAQAVRRAE